MPTPPSTASAQLILDGTSYELPIIVGSEGERSIDIRNLFNTTGYTVLDNGFKNSAACTSAITYVDGEQGVLRYCGLPSKI
mgnify:CR=1 FL=1